MAHGSPHRRMLLRGAFWGYSTIEGTHSPVERIANINIPISSSACATRSPDDDLPECNPTAILAGVETLSPRVSHLTEDEIYAYTIVDNKLAENACSNSKLLAFELGEVSTRKFQRRSSSTYDFLVTPQS
jgi:hypothetical protein